MLRTLILSLCMLLPLGGNQHASAITATVEQPLTEQSEQQAYRLMQDPVTASRFELPSQALHLWRQYKTSKPALVLFSTHPLLQPIDAALKSEVSRLVESGRSEDFYRQGSLARSNPLISPLQTLSAALDADLFSEIIWFFATNEELDSFSAQQVQERMQKAGFLPPDRDLMLEEKGLLKGRLHGVPLRIVHPLASLPEITRPALLHLDLGYFQGLYENGIRTPIYDLLHEVALGIGDTRIDCLAVSLSYSTEGGSFSLATRFLIDDLARLLQTPALLKGEMPESWRARREALYKREMFQESQARELISKAAKQFPQDPSIQFDYYQSLLQTGQETRAFSLLDRIITLDKGYAEEYLALAETAAENGWNERNLELLSKAERIQSDNPFITLFKIDTLLKMQRYQQARPLIEELQQQSWSTHVYPEMPAKLEQMANSILNFETTTSKAR